MDKLADFLDLPEDVREALIYKWCNLGWREVSMTQLSLARYSGAITVDGKRYTYMPETDELIRDDVLKAIKRHKRKARKALDEVAQIDQQLDL